MHVMTKGAKNSEVWNFFNDDLDIFIGFFLFIDNFDISGKSFWKKLLSWKWFDINMDQQK